LFRDEFNGPAGRGPSRLRWQKDKGGRGWGNNELQSYTGRPRNLALDGRGHLFITARREMYTGTDGITRDFTSARIKTQKRFSFQYGRADARVLVPRGRGLWPAFWALGDNINSVGWPLCGEIDVMEFLGSQPRIVHAAVHAGQAGGGDWLAGTPLRFHEPVAGVYHDYGMVWGPSGIAMSLDGRTFMTVSSGDLGPQDLWNFTHPFHLLLNLAVGGDWPGSPTSRTPFPAIMSVDYVRVIG
jgi:beta-glucanase (GH16 family)